MTKPTNNQLTRAERLVDRTFQTADAAERTAAAQAAVLDTYLALPEGRRAPLWRQMTDAQRRLVVAQQLVAKYDDWSEASVSYWVERTNARWGSEPTVTEVVTLEVLDEMEVTSPAAARAKVQFQAGVRPVAIVGGWQVPSATSPSEWYTVDRSGRCDCLGAFHGRHCWHASICVATEMAADRIDMGDGDDLDSDELALVQRLTAARRTYLEAA